MSHTPGNFQIRLTVPTVDEVKTLLGFYLTDRYFIFRHEPNPDNVHYHIYIFGLHRKADAIREKLQRAGIPKTSYIVATTCGGKKGLPITPYGAFQYATKPRSKPTLVDSQGFTTDELAQMKAESDKYYAPPENAILITKEDHYVVRPDRVWERLSHDLTEWEGLTVREIKSKISAQQLNHGKALMRSADLDRYAKSLFYMIKYKNQDCVPDDALISEY